jgi:hypothetical protein
MNFTTGKWGKLTIAMWSHEKFQPVTRCQNSVVTMGAQDRSKSETPGSTIQ